MPWPLGKKRTKAQIRKAARARWGKKAFTKTYAKKRKVPVVMTVDAGTKQNIRGVVSDFVDTVERKKRAAKRKREMTRKSFALADKIAVAAVHDAAKSEPLPINDVAFIKSKVNKERRLATCKFDPKKAPPPIRYVQSNEPTPGDFMTEVLDNLKLMGCPIVASKAGECAAGCPSSSKGDIGGFSDETGEVSEPQSQDKQATQPPTPQFAALSSKFIAELAFHMANLMKG